MRPPIKLNAIDKEHLQELFDAAGRSRDDLPYTDKFDEMWQGFQDRTFKNAEREQVFGALLKYTRTGGAPAADPAAPAEPIPLNDEQLKQLKAVLARYAKGGKVLPYSDELDGAKAEFKKLLGPDAPEMTERQFWVAIQKSQGPRRPPPKRKKAAVAADEDEAGDEKDDGDE